MMALMIVMKVKERMLRLSEWRCHENEKYVYDKILVSLRYNVVTNASMLRRLPFEAGLVAKDGL